MNANEFTYCTQCGHPGERAHAYCIRCGMPRTIDGKRRAGHVAFVLNELRERTMRDVLSETQRNSLEDQYAQQLRELIGRAAVAATAPAPVAAAPVVAPAPRPTVAPRVAKPREPMDWSWLAEQQANLFLFAGAFLTVVAALIYVGYSGEAISAALKMALFTGYTLAFLAAGATCLRYERVRIAGRVFFAVGALLVPMNFAVARAVFTEEDLSAETMWLAGSIVTACFYASIAWVGLGRMYAFGAGVAFVSAVIAFVVLTETPPEWAPAIFIAAALVMVATDLTSFTKLSDRIGAAWTWIGQAVGVLAAGTAIVMAPLAYAGSNDEFAGFDAATLWFLPTTLALFAAAAMAPAIVTRRDYFALAAIAALAGAGLSVAYGADMPAEGWAITAAATALGAAVLLVALDRDALARRLPPVSVSALFYTMHAAAVAAAIVAAFTLLATGDETDPYTIDWRWFGAIASGLAFVGFAVASVAPHARRDGESLTVAVGALASAAAATLGVVYARDLTAESYTIVLAGYAAVLGLLALGLRDARIARYAPRRIDDVAFVGGIVAICAAAGVAAGVLSATQREVDPYEMDNRWFITVAGALGLAFFKLASIARRGGAASDLESGAIAIGGIATAASGILGVLYALDRPAEDYAIAVGGIAGLMALAGVVSRDRRIAPYAPRVLPDVAFAAGVLASGAVGLTVWSLVAAAQDDADPYVLTTRWFALPAVALCAAFFAIDALAWKRRPSVVGFALAVTAACAAFVYGLKVSNEYYAFALLAPALAVAVCARWIPGSMDARIAPLGRDDAWLLGRFVGAGGVAIALGAVVAAAVAGDDWEPQSRWFLLPSLGLATIFALIDASRGRRAETSAAVAIGVTATALTLPYAVEAREAWYGVALAASGIALAAAGRTYTPSWIDGRARDAVAAIGVAVATLPFEGAYADHARLGAGVHVGAAAFFAAAALAGMRRGAAGRLLDLAALRGTPAATGWLYAAGLSVTIGYIDLLRAVGPDDPSGGGTLAMPMLTVALALIACGVAARYMRPEIRLHLYAMSLLAGIASLAAAPDAAMLASLLTVYVVAYAALAAFEDEPLFVIPSAAYGFLAVAAWRTHVDASYAVLPMTYAGVAVAAYAAALALRDVLPRWSLGLRTTGAAYALVAPAAGLALLAYAEDAEALRQTALYQWSTIAVAAVGLLAIVESSLMRRTWIAVPASAVLLVALLLQIARFEPENVQAYTTVIGAYMVLLGTVGLARMRLIPDAVDSAQYVEAVGTAIIMLPSFVQSLDADGWSYTLALLIEAASFFTAGVALRRRGILAAATLALVLVAGRTLFDAINAMPNWMVAAVIGIALLGIGMGILLGRDRWERWQRSVASWWQGTSGGALAH